MGKGIPDALGERDSHWKKEAGDSKALTFFRIEQRTLSSALFNSRKIIKLTEFHNIPWQISEMVRITRTWRNKK